MSIFDRIKRLARAEISEMKRVLSDRDAPADTRADPRGDSGESERQRAIREAEEELARADDDVLAAEIEAGAALWGDASAPPSRPDVADGAALWGHDEPAAARDAPRTARPTTSPYEGRTHAFPREIRDAYAALELPLGSPREAVEQAFRDMLHRYHPDKHAGDQRRQAMAHELTIRIREARQLLTSWLAGA